MGNPPYKILIIEDNPMNQKMAEVILSRSGFQTEFAQNGAIGFNKFTETKFDLILMDIHMPVMDGISSSKKIRNWEKSQSVTCTTPIIAVSAFAYDNREEECLSIGINEYLTKPYNPDDLIKRIQKHLA